MVGFIPAQSHPGPTKSHSPGDPAPGRRKQNKNMSNVARGRFHRQAREPSPKNDAAPDWRSTRSTFPGNLTFNFNGYTQTEAENLAGYLRRILRDLGHILNFSNLDGFTVAYDYDDATARLDRDYHTSHVLERTEGGIAREAFRAAESKAPWPVVSDLVRISLNRIGATLAGRGSIEWKCSPHARAGRQWATTWRPIQQPDCRLAILRLASRAGAKSGSAPSNPDRQGLRSRSRRFRLIRFREAGPREPAYARILAHNRCRSKPGERRSWEDL